MRLLKKDAQKISNDYSLGDIKNIDLIKGGLINYNFEIKTDKGKFIIRFLEHKSNEANKRKLKLEFKTLEFLNEKKFPYNVPYPIKNKKGRYLSNLNGKKFWIYKKINGKNVKKLNKEKLKGIVVLLATYHKFVKRIKLKKEDLIYTTNFFNMAWLKKEYFKMEKIKPKTKLGKLMKKNLELFSNILDKISKIDFNKNITITHSDFHKNNILFKGDVVIALLDFDNLETVSLIKDVAYAIQNTCIEHEKINKNKMNFFLKEYEKINKLSKEEKEIIIPAIIREKCIFFWWDYKEMKKRKDLKYKFMEDTIKIVKNLAKEIK